MIHPLIVKIDKTGRNALLVYHPNDDAADRLTDALGETVSDKRGAYVYPLNRTKRALFKALRCWFGSKGKIADWTRRWRCWWIVVLPGEFVRLPRAYTSHAAAMQAEVELLLLGDGDISRGYEIKTRLRAAADCAIAHALNMQDIF